jgi:hypothetical protein
VKKYLKFILVFIPLAFGSLLLQGCSAGQGDAWRYDPGIPAKVTGLKAESGNRVVTLSWTGNPLATSYTIYHVSGLSADTVTRSNATILHTTTTSQVIELGNNNIEYHFMVTALNRDGESVDSAQVSATPCAFFGADLGGVWYFHTLVTGPDAKWERGTLTVDTGGNAVISDFEDSSGNTTSPPGFVLTINENGEMSQSGTGALVGFHGILGSRKNLMTATWSPTLQSRAITIFQKKKSDSDPDYGIADISGTGSGQNPNNPYIQGNGPTRFAYHQLYSGATTEWEYCNAKVGQHGNIWLDQYKDIIYWDFSTPASKTLNYDYLWKVTSIGIDKDGLVTEYWNFANVVDPITIPSYNNLVPKKPHDTLFTGRMTADKTVVIGVATRTDVNGANPQYFLRIMQLCFIPTDQALPLPGVYDLAGAYKFHKLASTVPVGGGAGTASWAYGTMSITGSGLTSFPLYSDSAGTTQSSDSFTLSYYADPNPDQKLYTDFANFTTPVQAGQAHYYDAGGAPLRRYYDFASFGSYVGIPSTWRMEDTSPSYHSEHGSLSYNRDLFVMSRTDAAGYGMVIGLK